eukprot:TRINITY_DN948_c0_g1_i3.p1 TRINITY_DN948_c0_g1~~TRINITY_DN948_c0_g1_i3.p1  ORF type:complete len:885 (+),score=194.29 TRINITY_DN948_c0_g1_i3:358-2655(+)
MDRVLAFVVITFVMIASTDLYTAAASHDRAYPLFILLGDVVVVLRFSNWVGMSVLVCTLTWLAVLASEKGLRFGLMDIPGLESYEVRLERMVDCSKPPCETGIRAISDMSFYLTIFVVDFYVTRGFAQTAIKEQDRMNKTIVLAEEIASALVRFDLKVADKILEKQDDHTGITLAFMQLVANLKEYRPYLPDALFESGESSQDLFSSGEGRQTAPGFLSSKAAIVFTDIQSSTKIWEADPNWMKQALRIHNTVMRMNIAKHNGYEVKTIGDAFMVAFDTAVEACHFALDAQEGLYGADWPEATADLPPMCQPVEGAWKGLRTRMGIHVGDVDIENNPITGRADYFGPTVNKAARVEGACLGGSVAATDSVLAEIVGSSIGTPFIIPIGEVPLKGVAGLTVLSLLVPKSLQGRMPDLSATLKEKDVTAMDQSPSADEKANKGRRKRGSSNCSDQSVQSSVVSLVRPMPKRPDHLQSKLMRSESATISHFRVSAQHIVNNRDPMLVITEILHTVLDATERCDGSIASVSSTAIVISWNTTKRCASHLQSSTRCSSLVYRSLNKDDTFQTEWEEAVSVGTVTSSVLFGNVGTSKQKFVMNIGQSVDLAGNLSHRARKFHVFALATSLAGHPCIADDPAMRGYTRPIDTLRETGRQVVDIHQLRVSHMGKGMNNGSDPQADWGWSDYYIKAYNSGDHCTIVEHSDDPVLLRVANYLRSGPSAAVTPLPFSRTPNSGQLSRLAVPQSTFVMPSPAGGSMISLSPPPPPPI